jgi:hypothetical protein
MQLTMDCADPVAMVAFWCEALGYVPEPPPGGHPTWRAYWQSIGVPPEELPPGAGETLESIVDPTGKGPRIWFQQVPEPKTVKNRLHIDLGATGTRDTPREKRIELATTKVVQLTRAGGSVVRVADHPDTDYYNVVMADPEGNEFCVG